MEGDGSRFGQRESWASAKASASRTSAITGCRMYPEREAYLGQRSSFHLRAMAREGLSRSPELAAFPESWEMTDSIPMWDLDRVSR